MPITNDHLLLERPHPLKDGSVQRVYRFADDYGLSVVNSPMLHSYPFAWEAAVLEGVDDKGNFKGLTYDTPLTNDVEVFMSDDEANEFISRAAVHFGARK